MYNPKIRDELIPKIYEIARAKGIRMTTLVNEIIEKALDEINNTPSNEGNNKEGLKWTGKL